ncbi:MAG: group II truncated hemoglobin [Kangiellaceae bacterium]|nr:group II truncated hemoglobin [Kangiellaceae bacterium]MCW9000175.1 group II truncated hemoglobin [Kangiellaceae bacterium]
MAIYGQLDASYKAAGELEGIAKLVDDFYNFMDILPEANTVRAMHDKDLTLSRQKLTYFLSGWFGGPHLFAEHFGSISIPGVHKHLDVGEAERDAWILCMQKAVEQQDYADEFKVYLIEQLKIPAERVRMASQKISKQK